jgi:hypothetical protein
MKIYGNEFNEIWNTGKVLVRDLLEGNKMSDIPFVFGPRTCFENPFKYSPCYSF